MKPTPFFTKLTLLAGILLAPALAQAEFQQPHAAGIETYGYAWNSPDQDMNRALAHPADAAKGEAAYKICKGCHKPDGAGLADAEYPQLAGQHASVIIKQMMDIRAGRRDNPRMYPFCRRLDRQRRRNRRHRRLPQQIADSRQQWQRQRLQPDALGKALYHKDCASCHGKAGEGDAKKFYPMVAGQHFSYLKRETRESRDHGRRNASPEMVKSLQGYSDADVEAVSDYMSRLKAGR
jgi:cytochrome c553